MDRQERSKKRGNQPGGSKGDPKMKPRKQTDDPMVKKDRKSSNVDNRTDRRKGVHHDHEKKKERSSERRGHDASNRVEEHSRNNTNGHGHDNSKGRDGKEPRDRDKRKENSGRQKDRDRSGGREEIKKSEHDDRRGRGRDDRKKKDKDDQRSRRKEDHRDKDRDEGRSRDKDKKRSKDRDDKRKESKNKISNSDEQTRRKENGGHKEIRAEKERHEKNRNQSKKEDSSTKLLSTDDGVTDPKSATGDKKDNTLVKDSISEVEMRERAMLDALKTKESEEEPDYNYDEEEFDDYDDDFESENEDETEESDDSYNESDSYIDSDSSYNGGDAADKTLSEAERLQIREAMALENSRVGSSSPAMLPSSPANTPVPGSPANEIKEKAKQRRSGRGLDFATAQKSQAQSKALSKSAQRGNDLVRLIELDTIYFDLFELKPQTEYEIFMRSFGRSETVQKFTQYNEDCIDKETSTEPSDTKTCWTQHPIESSVASAHEGDQTEDRDESSLYNPVTLSKFISLSSQVIFTLLEERASRHGYTHTFKPTSESKISNSGAVFSQNPVLSGRSPIFLYPISAQSFVSCYSKPKTEGLVSSSGLSCTWNIQKVSDPVNYLVSNSPHRCACVSAYNLSIVFAGCEDGSICLWDLNEPESMHKSYQSDSKRFVTRRPTYSTSAIQVAESHNSKITSIQAIRFDQEQLQMSSYQLASLDESGVIVIWVVLPVLDSSFSGSQTDLGLRPGGKMKLVKSAAINSNFPENSPHLFPELRTYAFQQSYSDSNLYFVATDKGAVLKASRAQSLSQPNYYCVEAAIPSIVGSLDFNKFNWKYFLTGSSDGSISLYSVARASPLVSWDRSTRGRPVRSVRWSNYSSTIFYVVDSANKFYLWDLSVRDSTPLVIENFDQKGLLSCTELLEAAGSTAPVVVLGFKDGSIEAHQIKDEAMNNKMNNISKLEAYLSSTL